VFLIALAQAGISPDIQELLVHGNPSRGIAPGALKKAIAALSKAVSAGDFVLVPRVPSEAMRAAGVAVADSCGFVHNMDNIWSAMLSATPAAVKGGEERELLAQFVAELTNAGRNAPQMLSINHDCLAALVKKARATLTDVKGQTA
jgi:hypothetical protein